MRKVEHSPRGKAIRVAVLGGLLVALAGWVTYNLATSQALDVKPTTRKPTDFLVTWRCLSCGHQAKDLAGRGPRPCPECGQNDFYASSRWLCPRHGVFTTAFNYDEQGNPIQVKVADGPWVPYLDEKARRSGLHCPVCDRLMVPADSPQMPAEAKPPTPAVNHNPSEAP